MDKNEVAFRNSHHFHCICICYYRSFRRRRLYLDRLISWLIYLDSTVNKLFAVRRMYKKVKSMSEPKVYELDDINIKLTGQTLSATMDWSVVDRIRESEKDFLAFVSNGRGIHFLPKDGFDKDEDIVTFKNLVKGKQIKNNLKDVKSFSPLPLNT